MALSGWCSTHGRPQCDRCRDAGCTHDCHQQTETKPNEDAA
jgi:hypothetical protein